MGFMRLNVKIVGVGHFVRSIKNSMDQAARGAEKYDRRFNNIFLVQNAERMSALLRSSIPNWQRTHAVAMRRAVNHWILEILGGHRPSNAVVCPIIECSSMTRNRDMNISRLIEMSFGRNVVE